MIFFNFWTNEFHLWTLLAFDQTNLLENLLILTQPKIADEIKPENIKIGQS
jgi:hypothetical protein